jgi:hypothetical protein
VAPNRQSETTGAVTGDPTLRLRIFFIALKKLQPNHDICLGLIDLFYVGSFLGVHCKA